MLPLRLVRPRHTTTTSLQRVSKRASTSPYETHHIQIRSQRFQSNKPSSDPSSTTAQANRISRILETTSRYLPKRLQTSLQNLRSAPFSHVGAFLVLHEITAIIPVLGLTYAFYALDWVPTWPTEFWKQGSGASSEPRQDETSTAAAVLAAKEQVIDTATGKAVGTDEGVTKKYKKYAVHMAAAYAITKFLLVPRIAVSLWLTPWLARGFVGFRQAVRRIRK